MAIKQNRSKNKSVPSVKVTLSHIQSQLNAPERIFSKFIHGRLIERVSGFLDSTIARPSAILFGGLFAFFGVAGIYLFARFMGFSLSGTETIIMFTVGWLFGILFDIVRVIFKKT